MAKESTKTKGKGKQVDNLFMVVASDVEKCNQEEALAQALALANGVEEGYFRLGGFLKVIQEKAWFEGFETFADYVQETFGFKERKARYLMDIYTYLVDKQIPWESVSHIGWTKLKDLAPIITLENLAHWVEKAETLTVSELQQLIKGTDAVEEKVKTTDDVSKITFKLKNDQIEVVQTALAKVKAETGTEYDNSAIEMICASYLAGTTGTINVTGGTQKTPQEIMKELGADAVVALLDEVFPDVEITVVM